MIRYAYCREGWKRSRKLAQLLAAQADRVCEVGAGANPLLEPRTGYVLLDVSKEELAKAGSGYETILTDLSSPDFEPATEFEFVFRISVAEHIRNPVAFHRNIRRMLRPGGTALHFFSTLYASPFLANRLLPERLSRWILVAVDPTRPPEGEHANFRAYYRWCRGLTGKQIRRFESRGFAIERYEGYFGHGYYKSFHLQPLVDAVAHGLERHPIPALTSFALVVLTAR